jgi:SAM-dependent MidA family methyltransferase
MAPAPGRFAAPAHPIPVEQFLASALHDPDYGYYRTRGPAPGRTGDFVTMPGLHPVLGRAIAAWIRSRGRHAPPDVIELGGGDGSLLSGVLRSLGWLGRRARRFHLVESSERMRAAQRAKLARWPGVRWHPTIESALESAGGSALIFSNEFVDAFPCAVLERDCDGWREVLVGWRSDGVARETPGAAMRAIRGVNSCCFGPWDGVRPGQRVEIHAAYAEWLRAWAPRWKVGAMLTIDYGAAFPALYHRRPRGTLRGYFRHTPVHGTDLYQNPGHQDITADVNFTDLVRWGEAAGLRTLGLRNLRSFIREMLGGHCDAGDPVRARLLDTDGAGGAFQVLEQQPEPAIATAAATPH